MLLFFWGLIVAVNRLELLTSASPNVNSLAACCALPTELNGTCVLLSAIQAAHTVLWLPQFQVTIMHTHDVDIDLINQYDTLAIAVSSYQ